ncbi:T3SS effector OspC family protein, partial [Shigella flexneri]|uniref:T3SS effector OspC family protein n=1 Tax=Shigella flexneri TaxID=623 RepID=UPI0007D8A6DF
DTTDSGLTIGVHLICFIRRYKDDCVRQCFYNKNSDPVRWERIINMYFQLELHRPILLSSDNFKKIRLRDISLEDAIKASNYEEINNKVTDKKMAHQALAYSLGNAKSDMALYLLSKFNFTKQDIAEMEKMNNNMYCELYDVEYLLSEDSANYKVLEYFISNGLVDVYKRFQKANSGDTMLDNAMKSKDSKTIDFLLKNGAVSGKRFGR